MGPLPPTSYGRGGLENMYGRVRYETPPPYTKVYPPHLGSGGGGGGNLLPSHIVTLILRTRVTPDTTWVPPAPLLTDVVSGTPPPLVGEGGLGGPQGPH